MPKNILIFSDGTGQAGGLLPDETRSNVYKLFRATRCGPESMVNPEQQLAFYDPGLGSASDGASIKFKAGRRIYNILSQATGLGITHNIIDCYAALIQMYEPGDRIYLFGFSRGAYTARCVGGVIGLCGVPTTMKDGTSLLRDPASANAIATEAVKQVYQFGSSVRGDPYRAARLERARKFRQQYGSGDEEANVVPYFVGVWDTVAALGAGYFGLSVLFAVSFAVLATAVKYIAPLVPTMPKDLSWTTSATVLAAAAAFLYVGASAYYRQWLSLARFRMAFYDTKLNPRICYARHALSIDENRRDFARVSWQEDGAAVRSAEAGAVERFIQMWFSGNHSDVGGSYPENESRLPDISLKWMVDEARSLPHPIIIDERYMRSYPSASGPQHDERRSAIAKLPRWIRRVADFLRVEDKLGWAEGHRKIPPDAPLHPTVIKRFDCKQVLVYGAGGAYRPE